MTVVGKMSLTTRTKNLGKIGLWPFVGCLALAYTAISTKVIEKSACDDGKGIVGSFVS